MQGSNQNTAEYKYGQSVLGASTSKMVLSGSIIFQAPLNAKEDITMDKNLSVGGESVFTGNITAPNILYGVRAGDNVVITNQASQNPVISVDLSSTVSSFQGQAGDVKLQAGSDISISGLTVSDISTLQTVTSRGHCDSCITDADVVNGLTIDSTGNIAGEAIKTGVVGTTFGGTGLTSYAEGDLMYSSASNILSSLPIGTASGQVLQVENGVPAWSTIALNAAGTDNLTSGANLVGVYSDLVNSGSNNLQQVLKDLDTSIVTAGISPFTVGTDATYGGYIRPDVLTNDLVFGGNGTPLGSSLFFNSSAASLSIGTSGVQNGTLNILSAGSTATGAALTVNNAGNLLIQNSNVGIGAIPSDVDADNHPFELEVAGSIGPNQNAVYDLGSPTMQYRNLYLTGQTTSGGNITIANPAPAIFFVETDNSNYQFSVNTNNSQFVVRNDTNGTNDIVASSSGDISLAGGVGDTGCTVTNSNGNIACSGNITGTNNGIVGYWGRNNTTGIISPATNTDTVAIGNANQLTIDPSGNLLTSGTINGLTITNNGTNTLNIAAGKTLKVDNGLAFSGTDNTAFIFPSTTGGTVLTGNAPSQVVTSAQTIGTILGLADSGGLTGNIVGQAISLTGANAHDQTGLLITLSGATGANLNALVVNNGATDTAKIAKSGAATFVGVDSGTGLISGTGGETVTGTINLNSSGLSVTNIGTGTGNVSIGNTTGTLTLGKFTTDKGLLFADGSGVVSQTAQARPIPSCMEMERECRFSPLLI